MADGVEGCSEVGCELSGDSTFQYFRQTGEVGNGLEVGHDIRI